MSSDPEKALRFFHRAINSYNTGLTKFPKSFDLAYNKAVLQYQILQEPRIRKQISSNRISLLNEAIQSHRYALGLNQENADILFNTAQVLTTAAEVAQDSDVQTEALALLKEAVELFSSCLSRQELEYTESQAQAEGESAPQNEDDGDLERMSTASSQPPPEWATVLEPVMPRTLVDTALAELSALTTLVSLTSTLDGADVNDYRASAGVAANLIQHKLPQYIALIPTTPEVTESKPTTRFLSLSDANPTLHVDKTPAPTSPREEAQNEANLAGAVFTAALTEAEYRAHLYSTRTYFDRIVSTFESIHASASQTPTHTVLTYSAFADALVAFASAVSEVSTSEAETPQETQGMRWEALTRAQSLLAETATLLLSGVKGGDVPGETSVALVRGNVEMLRRQMLLSAEGDMSAVMPPETDAASLLRDAASYYARTAAAAVHDDEEREDARIKAAICSVLQGGAMGDTLNFLVTGASRAQEIVGEMVEEGMLSEEERNRLAELMV